MARRACMAALMALVAVGCADDLRKAPSDDGRYDVPPEQREVEEPVHFVQRTPGVAYNLPRPGQPGIADLIALLPDRVLEADEADTFMAPGEDLQCNNGKVTELDGLPMTLEAIVTLHPRQYLKVPICDQDERNYGAYTIEDDTGGIVVLRNSRVAWFTAGDRVRLTVRGLMYTFRSPTTRVVLVADVERLDPPSADAAHTVLYDRLTAPFDIDDITEIRRVEGVIIQSPTNANFGTMRVASKAIPDVEDDGSADPVCTANCRGRCRPLCGDICEGRVCPAVCAGGVPFEADALPVCWSINIDAELGRRGFSPPEGARVAVTGPVFESFDMEMWVQRLGQIEVLDGN
ncbi:MAG: hypothetical protein KC620_07060 [Myxococcales bacterium]|nr:hypothetical protein [Myxococcales bacterium]